MNPSIDIERELDLWLGPDEDRLPSRVLDAALVRIDSTAQRRGRAVPRWRTPHMSTLLRYGGAVAALLAILAGTALLFGGERRSDRSTPPEPPASAALVAPVPSPTVAPMPTPLPTPVPTPIWTSPPLTGRFVSDGYGYAVAIPEGYIAQPATESWSPSKGTDMASPWLERINSADYLVTFTARSTPLDPPLTTDAWLDLLVANDEAPAGSELTCDSNDTWAPVPIGDETGRYYHEHCGPLWAVVSVGDRGYIFTLNYSVEDTEINSAPFIETFKEMLAGMDLTPETATLN